MFKECPFEQSKSGSPSPLKESSPVKQMHKPLRGTALNPYPSIPGEGLGEGSHRWSLSSMQAKEGSDSPLQKDRGQEME